MDCFNSLSLVCLGKHVWDLWIYKAQFPGGCLMTYTIFLGTKWRYIITSMLPQCKVTYDSYLETLSTLGKKVHVYSGRRSWGAP